MDTGFALACPVIGSQPSVDALCGLDGAGAVIPFQLVPADFPVIGSSLELIEPEVAVYIAGSMMGTMLILFVISYGIGVCMRMMMSS